MASRAIGTGMRSNVIVVIESNLALIGRFLAELKNNIL